MEEVVTLARESLNTLMRLEVLEADVAAAVAHVSVSFEVNQRADAAVISHQSIHNTFELGLHDPIAD